MRRSPSFPNAPFRLLSSGRIGKRAAHVAFVSIGERSYVSPLELLGRRSFERVVSVNLVVYVRPTSTAVPRSSRLWRCGSFVPCESCRYVLGVHGSWQAALSIREIVVPGVGGVPSRSTMDQRSPPDIIIHDHIHLHPRRRRRHHHLRRTCRTQIPSSETRTRKPPRRL